MMNPEAAFLVLKEALDRADLNDSAKLLFCRLLCDRHFRELSDFSSTMRGYAERFGVSEDHFSNGIIALARAGLVIAQPCGRSFMIGMKGLAMPITSTRAPKEARNTQCQQSAT
jgi:hypothetical protein